MSIFHKPIVIGQSHNPCYVGYTNSTNLVNSANVLDRAKKSEKTQTIKMPETTDRNIAEAGSY
jgi:hypothetical protein